MTKAGTPGWIRQLSLGGDKDRGMRRRAEGGVLYSQRGLLPGSVVGKPQGFHFRRTASPPAMLTLHAHAHAHARFRLRHARTLSF